MNKFIGIGRLTKDAELRFSQTGTAIANSSIAIEDGFGDKKKTFFFNLVVIGKFAETFAEWTFKGQRIAIEGKLQQRDYEKDGRKLYITEIVTQNVEFLERKRTPEFDSPKGHFESDTIELDDLPW